MSARTVAGGGFWAENVSLEQHGVGGTYLRPDVVHEPQPLVDIECWAQIKTSPPRQRTRAYLVAC